MKASFETLYWRLLFGGLLVAWAWQQARRLPAAADFMSLHYLLSLERGAWKTPEWVHPLWVPALSVYQALWRLAGWKGAMLFPVEGLDVALGAVALGLAFRLAERVSGEGAAAAAGAALLAWSEGFRNACLRTAPYAAAAAATLACLSWLWSERPSSGRRWALAGAAAGAAAGLDLAALSLLVAGAAAAWREPKAPRLERFAAFAAGFGAALAVSYAAFLAYHGVGAAYFAHATWSGLFHGVEQAPGSSVYTAPSPWAQAAGYAATVLQQGGALLPLALLSWAALAVRPASDAVRRRAALLTGAAAAAFAAFFAINNARNALVFISLLTAPAALALAASRGPAWRAAALSLACLGFGAELAARQAPWTPDGVQAEARFLLDRVGREGAVLVPGCPSPDADYLLPLRLLSLTEGRPFEGCAAPAVRPGPELDRRLSYYAARGGEVFLALRPAAEGRPLYAPAGPAPAPESLGLPADAERIVSPRGAVYARLGPRPDASAAPWADAGQAPAGDAAERRAFLRAWLARAPDDLYARADLSALDGERDAASETARPATQRALAALERGDLAAARAEWRAGDADEEGLRLVLDVTPWLMRAAGAKRKAWARRFSLIADARRAMDRRVERSPLSAARRVDRGIVAYLFGDFPAAERDFRQALALRGDYGAAYLSLGALYVEEGRRGRAAALYREGLRRASPGPEADMLRSSLAGLR